MTSKDIVIRLIDSQVITGEEAYILFNDILKGEMVALNEALQDINKTSTKQVSPYGITWASATTDPTYIGALSVDNKVTPSTSTTIY